MRRHPFLVPTLLAALATAAEPVTTTSWEVRHDAEELIEDILKHRADDAELISRALRLAENHGSELLAAGPTEAAPISGILAERLTTAGLAGRFAEEAAAPAQRRLAILLANPATSQAALVNFARSVPGTAAADQAWRLAADLAWDRGDLRLYQDAALSAQDGNDPGRRTRPAAAAALMRLPGCELPGQLDGLDAMWRIALDATPGPTEEGLPNQRRPARPSIAACGGSTIALSDGRSLMLIDPLVGAVLGRRLRLGSFILPTHVSRPAAVRGGVVAAGIADGQAVLVCADTSGRERWRSGGGERRVRDLSAPLVDGGLVYLAYRDANGERDELRLLAVHEVDGSPAWDIAVASLAGHGWGEDGAQPPSLALHARGVVVSSNAGLISLVGSDGGVRRAWSYPTRPVESDYEGVRRGRRGLAAGDGRAAVLTPADHPGLVWILGPDDASPRAYRGDGADGDVIAAQDGEALLAGRQVALLDLARLRLRWTVPLRLAEPNGLLGSTSALVAGGDQLVLLDRRNGTSPGGKGLRTAATMLACDGMLILADPQEVRGFGDATAFLSRLRAAASSAGSDPRPHAALASVLAGRGEMEAALAEWRRALDLDAGPEVATRVAGVLRTRIEAGGSTAQPALVELQRLTRQLPGLASELPLWRARLAEAAGDRLAAAGAYAELLAGPDRPVDLPDGLALSLHLLAQAGRVRCQAAGALFSPLDISGVAPTATPATAWRVSGRMRGAALVAGGSVLAYADGLLRAWDLADGRERWRRTPKTAQLGVTEGRNPPPGDPGVAINVLPGSAADAAGLKNGDILLRLNSKELASFANDLRPTVLALGGGSPFTFAVKRGTAELTVTGRLGGEPVEPLAGDGRVLLARTTMNLEPRSSDLRFFVVDAATGADLWTHTLGAAMERLDRARPLLTPGGVVCATDGPDLVGIAAMSGRRLWSLPGRAALLERTRPVGRCAWMITPDGEGVLLDPASGAELVSLSGIDPEILPALSGDALAVRQKDALVAIWDLGRGRLRCRTTAPATPVALRGDSLLATDQRNRPVVIDAATGAVRRVLGDDIVDSWANGPVQVILALAAPDRRRLAAVACDGMTELWSLDLPPGTEIAALEVSGSGTLATIQEGKRAYALLIDHAGSPVGCTGWSLATGPRRGPQDPLADQANRGVLAAGAAAIALEPEGLRVFLPGLAAPPAALRCLDLGNAGLPREALAKRSAELVWSRQGVPIALARHGMHLLCVVRPAEAEVRLFLSDTVGPMARDTTQATIGAQGTRSLVPGSWTLAEAWSFSDASGPLACSLWAPLPSRAPGSPLAVLVNTPAAPGDLPWWLMAGWTRIEATP